MPPFHRCQSQRGFREIDGCIIGASDAPQDRLGVPGWREEVWEEPGSVIAAEACVGWPVPIGAGDATMGVSPGGISISGRRISGVAGFRRMIRDWRQGLALDAYIGHHVAHIGYVAGMIDGALHSA